MGLVLLLDVTVDLFVRRCTIVAVHYFTYNLMTFFSGLIGCIAIGCNTEDSADVPINRDDIALGFLVLAWASHYARIGSTFVQRETAHFDCVPLEIPSDTEKGQKTYRGSRRLI